MKFDYRMQKELLYARNNELYRGKSGGIEKNRKFALETKISTELREILPVNAECLALFENRKRFKFQNPRWWTPS